VREGKDVLEISVRTATKGDSIEHLRAYTNSTAVFFAGDDVTDEDGFEALEADDLGLKAGEGATLANFRVKGPEDVARVLTLLADLREGDVHEQ
jgi:trehalose 6-phosphate phosphatase